MKVNIYMLRVRFIVITVSIILLSACNNQGKRNKEVYDDDIVQKTNGHILLSMKDAYMHYDKENPDQSTAEWGFTVNSKGRYEIWLSSLTLDTMNLSYEEPVIIHFGDKRIEKQPVGNRIVLDDDHVVFPYYRADSKLGSILIEDSGHYNLQVISEKVLPVTEDSEIATASTILEQIILVPLTH